MKQSIQLITTTYNAHASREVAAGQAAYMRNLFPFLGISKPVRNKLDRALFKQIQIDSQHDLENLVRALYKLSEREYHGLAYELAYKHLKKCDASFITTLKFMITTKSWWDTVDLTASNLVGKLVARCAELQSEMDEWIDHENMWLRRSALLYQLKYKTNTDEKRLFSYIKKRMHEQEFFIRKAIGWVLREYSKTNRHAVALFIEKNRSKLSPLSVREGSKYL